MSQPANTFDSYAAATSNKEDVQDRIYMVTPESTPVLSAGRRFTASQRIHEWVRDSLATPNASNAVIEGADRTGTAIVAPQRVSNTTQLMDKVAIISSAQEATKSFGRSSDMKFQVGKMMKELKRDVEARLVSNLPAVIGSGVLARQTAGMGCMIFTTALHGAGGSTPTHNSGTPTVAPTPGTARAFAEPLLRTALQSIYTQSGEMPTFLSMSPSHKALFSGFPGIAVNRFNIKGKEQATVIGGADIYVGDFGSLTIIPNYVQATSAPNDVFILHPDAYGVAYLQGYNSVALAKGGHNDRELVCVEAACVVTAERAVGKIAALTA